MRWLRKRCDPNSHHVQYHFQNLEILAQEKLALEKLLESEKQTLANDKQDLADQLKKCFNQVS